MVDAYLGPLKLTGLAEENLQARVRGTTADGPVQPARPPGAGHRQQERARGRLLHALRRRRRRLRAAEGRAQDAGVAAGAVAQQGRRGRGETPPIPESSISKPPSAELRPGQLDTDSLPAYEVLDDVLDDYVEQDRGLERAGRGRLRPRAGRAGAEDDRHRRVQAPAVPTRPEDLAARPSAATAGCPSPTAGASTCCRGPDEVAPEA